MRIDFADFDAKQLWRLQGLIALKHLSFGDRSGAELQDLDLSVLAHLDNLETVAFARLHGLKELRFPQFDQQQCNMARVLINRCPDLEIIDLTQLNFRADNLTVRVDEYLERLVQCGQGVKVEVIDHMPESHTQDEDDDDYIPSD